MTDVVFNDVFSMIHLHWLQQDNADSLKTKHTRIYRYKGIDLYHGYSSRSSTVGTVCWILLHLYTIWEFFCHDFTIGFVICLPVVYEDPDELQDQVTVTESCGIYYNIAEWRHDQTTND